MIWGWVDKPFVIKELNVIVGGGVAVNQRLYGRCSKLKTESL